MQVQAPRFSARLMAPAQGGGQKPGPPPVILNGPEKDVFFGGRKKCSTRKSKTENKRKAREDARAAKESAESSRQQQVAVAAAAVAANMAENPEPTGKAAESTPEVTEASGSKSVDPVKDKAVSEVLDAVEAELAAETKDKPFKPTASFFRQALEEVFANPEHYDFSITEANKGWRNDKPHARTFGAIAKSEDARYEQLTFLWNVGLNRVLDVKTKDGQYASINRPDGKIGSLLTYSRNHGIGRQAADDLLDEAEGYLDEANIHTAEGRASRAVESARSAVKTLSAIKADHAELLGAEALAQVEGFKKSAAAAEKKAGAANEQTKSAIKLADKRQAASQAVQAATEADNEAAKGQALLKVAQSAQTAATAGEEIARLAAEFARLSNAGNEKYQAASRVYPQDSHTNSEASRWYVFTEDARRSGKKAERLREQARSEVAAIQVLAADALKANSAEAKTRVAGYAAEIADRVADSAASLKESAERLSKAPL